MTRELMTTELMTRELMTTELMTLLMTTELEVPRAAVCKTQSLSVEGSLQYIAVHIVEALPNSAPWTGPNPEAAMMYRSSEWHVLFSPSCRAPRL